MKHFIATSFLWLLYAFLWFALGKYLSRVAWSENQLKQAVEFFVLIILGTFLATAALPMFSFTFTGNFNPP